MTYVIDLHQLWEGLPSGAKQAKPGIARLARVSVVLVVSGHHDIFRSLNSVISQFFLREVIVVELGLPAALKEKLDNYSKKNARCHVISGHEQMGLAEAYNVGSCACSGEYLFFMTERLVLPKNAFSKWLVFARRKTTPYVIGHSVKPTEFKWAKKREKIISKLTNFNAQMMMPGPFVHTTKVEAEGLFVSERYFSMLKGMDTRCFDATLSWDFCLRIQYAGGDVFEAKHFQVHYQAPLVSRDWLKNVRRQWRNYLSWRYFYENYVSDKTHFLTRMLGQVFFFLQFVWDSVKI